MMKRNRIIAWLIFLTLSVDSWAQDTLMILKDYNLNQVDFFLTSSDKKVILISNNGFISEEKMVEYQNTTFTLHFDNHLAYLLYHNDLYNKNGKKLSDDKIISDQITLSKLKSDPDGVFFVRRKEIKLDDD